MPLTVHAAWLRFAGPNFGGEFFLWAEEVDFSATSVSTRTQTRGNGAPAARSGNGRQRLPKIPSHPGQISIGQLRSLLTAEFPDILIGDMQPGNAVVWLPSQDGAPLVRRGLIEHIDQINGGQVNGMGGNSSQRTQIVNGREAAALAPWQVTGLALTPFTALTFLARLTDFGSSQATSAVGVWHRLRFGTDLLFWSNAAKFALEILAGQHYMPSLHAESSGRLEAIWQPILLDPRVEQRRDQLVQTMPAVCRAYNLDTLSDAPAPATLTEHFVSTLVDTTIRAWAEPLAPAVDAMPATQWLRKLLSSEFSLNLPPQPAHELYQVWRQWAEQLYVVRDANFRICFVLEEPKIGEQVGANEPAMTEHLTWNLHYYLQARDNLNLMIPARQVWRTGANLVQIGNRHVDQPQERLLAGLGVASRLFAPIERSLHNPRPELSLLSTDEAYQFLREIGPLLESSGFGIVLPDWWDASRRMRLGLHLRFSTHNDEATLTDLFAAGGLVGHTGQLGLNSMIDYRWELTLAGEQLSKAEFEQLAAIRTPLLRLRDSWVELDPQQVAAAKRFLASRPPVGAATLLQAIRVAQAYLPPMESEAAPLARPSGELRDLPAGLAPPADASEALPLDAVSINGWLGTVLARLRDQQPLTSISEPPGFVGELRPYQERGVGWLDHLRQLGLGACLADDMGLGKTIQAIALLLHMRSQAAAHNGGGANLPPTLLICPTSVVANWRREIERFAPGLRALVHHGNNRLSGAVFVETAKTQDLIITSYGTARRDVELLAQFVWNNLILDEAQNIKNPTAKQTQAVRRLRGVNRIALTGTPVENRLSELWSIMEFLNPGYLGSQEAFRQRYVIPIERYNDQERTDELRRLVQPFLLRRLKSDPTIISDLPEKNEMVVYCSLTREQAALYEKVVQNALAELNRSDGIQRRGLVLALLTKLKQITNHPAHFLKERGPLAGRSGKLNRLTEMLDEALSVGDRALIFTQFVEMGHLLQRHLGETLGIDTLFLHGGTSANQRDKMVQAFQTDDGPPVFVLSLRAGGSGLNLTRANHVFHYDRWWNPAVENQATDRAFRIGQQRNVQVHKFVVAGTLEERIHDLIESKQALARSIVGSGEEWLTELDTEQLRDLLTLRYDAIEDE